MASAKAKVQQKRTTELCLLGLVFGGISAQTPTHKIVPAKGTLSARVFAITNGGDLKPARMASVYVLYLNGITPKTGSDYDAGTSGSTYVRESTKAMQQLSQRGTGSEDQDCVRQLQMFDSVVSKVLEWSEQNKKSGQVVFTHTDEEGNFKVDLQPGEYTILVRGRAGFNEAYWDTNPLEDVTIKPHDHIDIKLSSPVQSCPTPRR